MDILNERIRVWTVAISLRAFRGKFPKDKWYEENERRKIFSIWYDGGRGEVVRTRRQTEICGEARLET